MNRPLDGNEAAQRREVVVMMPSATNLTGATERFTGDQVYSVSPLGIVIALGQTRMFYPWNRVTSFNYHVDDASARRVIQGY